MYYPKISSPKVFYKYITIKIEICKGVFKKILLYNEETNINKT